MVFLFLIFFDNISSWWDQPLALPATTSPKAPTIIQARKKIPKTVPKNNFLTEIFLQTTVANQRAKYSTRFST